MSAFSKNDRDIAMKILCDFYSKNDRKFCIEVNHLHNFGLPKSIDPIQIVEVLESMGYVESKSAPNSPRNKIITLTDAGKCYFENKADKDHEKRIENVRYLITTAIAILALVLAGISLAAQLGLIQLQGA